MLQFLVLRKTLCRFSAIKVLAFPFKIDIHNTINQFSFKPSLVFNICSVQVTIKLVLWLFRKTEDIHRNAQT